MAKQLGEKSGWAVGGGLMIGVGVGFFFLPASGLYMVGSVMAGLGLGLLVGALIANK